MSYKKFLIINQGVIPSLFNFVINGTLAWWINKDIAAIPLWGEQSIAMDLLATAFLLPLITCLIASPLVASSVRQGKVPPLKNGTPLPGVIRHLFTRSLVVGVMATIFAALPVVLLFQIFGLTVLSATAFIGFKACFAALLAMMFSVLIAWWALRDASWKGMEPTIDKAVDKRVANAQGADV